MINTRVKYRLFPGSFFFQDIGYDHIRFMIKHVVEGNIIVPMVQVSGVKKSTGKSFEDIIHPKGIATEEDLRLLVDGAILQDVDILIKEEQIRQGYSKGTLKWLHVYIGNQRVALSDSLSTGKPVPAAVFDKSSQKDDEFADPNPQNNEETDPFEVDGIKLDPDNQEFQYALQFALESNRNLYLTGKAGSGKTTFLKYLRKVTNKNMVVVAPTGVAAVNAGGQTIHSFFRIAPSLYTPNDKRLRRYAPPGDEDQSTIYDNFQYNKEHLKIIQNLELLVIDEVSMVRADLLDVVDTLLRVYRKNYRPFGGVQVILIGDTFQLPPVVKGEDKDLLMMFYDSEFFFSAKVIQHNKPLYIELKKIYRQNERDFIDLLNRVRVNNMIPADFQTLARRYNPSFVPAENDNYIILATKNDRVNEVNDRKLAELTTPLKEYIAKVEDEFPEKDRPTDTELHLKVGAQVMFVKNDRDKRFYNGKLGVVKGTNDDEVKVEIENGQGIRKTLSISRETWKKVEYSWDEENKCIIEKVVGTFTQFPLRLAWAITVHKSQGLTFEKVIADIGDSFASGQVYVALSRCTSMNGLVLLSPITPRTVKTDPRVLKFAQNETPETLLTEQLSTSKADFYYGEARKAFHAHDANKMVECFRTAIKYRNDIETDTFRRYISTWAGRLFQTHPSDNDIEATVMEKNQTIEKLSEDIKKMEEKLHRETIDSRAKTKQIKELNELVNYIDDQRDSLDRDLKDTTRELENAKRARKVDATKMKSLKAEIEQLNKQIQEQASELEIERNKKWYHKIFGK